MGFFNNYLKEGPGIDKNAPKKKGIFLFFEVFFRKFFKLIKAGIFYFLESIPFLAIAIFLMAPFITKSLGIGEAIFSSIGNVNSILVFYVFIGCALLNFFGSGPASAGYAYVTRCFVRGEHTWVWSDGWDKIKENFKNSILLMLLDIAVVLAGVYGIYFYGAFASDMPGIVQSMFAMCRGALAVIFLLYVMLHIFAYQIMVTYECGFKDLLKNSFIMMMANLPMCVLLTVVTGVMFGVSFVYLGKFGVLLYAIVGIQIMRFPLEFYAARVIEKNIKRVKKKEKKKLQQSVDEGIGV